MFPTIDLDIIKENISYVEDQITMSAYGLVPKYDFKEGEFVFDDHGRVVMLSGVEAVKMWIIKILYTTINRYEIYYNASEYREYGSDLKPRYFGKRLPDILVLGDMENELSEALSRHRLINSLENFWMREDGHILYLEFDVILNDDMGTVKIKEEVRIPKDERENGEKYRFNK